MGAYSGRLLQCLNASVILIVKVHCLINYFLFVYVKGSCTDYTGAYSCTCHPGYSGQNCSIDIDECESSPCINGE